VDPQLRESVNRVVGNFFFGTLLKSMRDSVLQGKYGHGGRGEEIFQAQLDQVFAEGAGLASNFGLSRAIMQRLDPATQYELFHNTNEGLQNYVEPRNE
jgi:Rod binding domain-containing protein